MGIDFCNSSLNLMCGLHSNRTTHPAVRNHYKFWYFLFESFHNGVEYLKCDITNLFELANTRNPLKDSS